MPIRSISAEPLTRRSGALRKNFALRKIICEYVLNYNLAVERTGERVAFLQKSSAKNLPNESFLIVLCVAVHSSAEHRRVCWANGWEIQIAVGAYYRRRLGTATPSALTKQLQEKWRC